MAPTVADVMVRTPKVRSGATTVREARADLLDDHVHAVLVVAGAVLVAVVEAADLDVVRADLAVRRRRRLADVDERGRLLGLLEPEPSS